jgi:hypothetical protein
MIQTEVRSQKGRRFLWAFAPMLLVLGACEQDAAKQIVTEPPRLLIEQTDKVVTASRKALRAFLDVMTPGTSCLGRLRQKGVRFVSLPDKETKRGCGYTNAVKVSGFGDVGVSKDIIMRCPVAERVSDWLNKTVQPAADKILNTRVTKLMVSSAYRCRNSRGIRWGKKRYRLSQHAYGNAFDLWGFQFANKRHTRVRDDWKYDLAAAREKAQGKADAAEKLPRRSYYKLMREIIEREKARQTMRREPKLPKKKGDMAGFWHYVSISACNTFNKVFTPEYDRVHRHHIHFDLAPTRLCGVEGEFRRPVKRKKKGAAKKRRIASRP